MKKVNYTLVIFILLGLRSVAVGSNIGDALAIIGVLGVVGFEKYLESKKGPDINAALREELDSIKSSMSAISIRNGVKETARDPQKEFKRFF